MIEPRCVDFAKMVRAFMSRNARVRFQKYIFVLHAYTFGPICCVASGHDWVTKRSANTTREDRSRLKVNGTAIDCHYAHGISPRSFHRRIYQLQGNSLNLVHYLDDGQVDKADPASTSSTARRLLLGSGKSQRQSHRNHADGGIWGRMAGVRPR